MKKKVEEQVEKEPIMEPSMYLVSSVESLQRMLEEATNAEDAAIYAKGIAEIGKVELEQNTKEAELALREQEVMIAEKQLTIAEKQTKATKVCAVLGLVGVGITAGLRFTSTVVQGLQAIQFQREGYKEEKSENAGIYKSNKHLIPSVFTKN